MPGRTRPDAPYLYRWEYHDALPCSLFSLFNCVLFGLKARLTFRILNAILWPMKKAIFLTDPAEMRKARLNQPRVSLEQLQRQLEAFQRAAEKFSEDARKETSSTGRVKTAGF